MVKPRIHDDRSERMFRIPTRRAGQMILDSQDRPMVRLSRSEHPRAIAHPFRPGLARGAGGSKGC
eukprot:12019190-Alexandrium_andersonii.AAC.1